MDREARRPPRSQESRSQFARLGGMFFSPGRTFGELARSPVIAAALIALALTGAIRATAVSRAGDLDAVAQHTFEQQTERMPRTFARGMSDADRERGFGGSEGSAPLFGPGDSLDVPGRTLQASGQGAEFRGLTLR